MSVKSKSCVFLCALVILAVFSPASGEEHLAPPEIWTAREAVRFAITNNPDTAMAQQRLVAAQAEIGLEKAALYPQLDFSGRYSQTNNPMYSFGNILNQGAFNSTIDFNNPGRTDDLNTGVHLTYNLFNGGRDQASVDAALASADAAEMTIGVIKEQLALQAVRNFNQIVLAEKMVKIHTAALNGINSMLAVAQARQAEGDLLKVDILNLQVQQTEGQENLITAQNSLTAAHQTFLNLMGLEAGKVTITSAPDDLAAIPESSSRVRRLEIDTAQAMVRTAEARLRKARGGKLPVVEGFAAFDYDQGWEMAGSGHSWQAGVFLRYNLFDGYRTSAAMTRASAMLAEARAQLRKTKLAISLEETRARLAFANSETRLLVTAKGVEQATASARINRARFLEGAVLTSDLITAENQLTAALLRHEFTETANRIAGAELRRALGLPQFSVAGNNHNDPTLSAQETMAKQQL